MSELDSYDPKMGTRPQPEPGRTRGSAWVRLGINNQTVPKPAKKWASHLCVTIAIMLSLCSILTYQSNVFHSQETFAILAGAVGCAEITPEAVCLYTSGSTISIWIDAPPTEVEVRIDGKKVPSSITAVDAGFRCDLTLQPSARRVSLHANGGRFIQRVQWVPDLKPKDRSRRQAYTLAQQGWHHYQAGRVDTAYSAFQRAEQVAQATGDHTRQWALVAILTFIEVVHRGTYAQAATRLDQLPAPLSIDAHTHARVYWAKGVLERRLFLHRAALRSLDKAIRWGERVRFPGRYHAENERAVLLLDMELIPKAATTLTQLAQQPDADTCSRAMWTANAAWARFMAHTISPSAAEASFQQALTTFTSTCTNPLDADHQRVNLAMIRLHQDDHQGATEWLEQMEGTDPETRLWALLMTAHIARKQKHTIRASEIYQTVAALAHRTSRYDAAWEAELGAGQAYLLDQAYESAIRHFQSAEKLVTRNALLLPANQRSAFFADRAESGRLLVQTQINHGSIHNAFQSARSARRRHWTLLSALKRRDALAGDDWQAWTRHVEEFQTARRALDRHHATTWSTSLHAAPRISTLEKKLLLRLDRAADDALQFISNTLPSISPELPNNEIVLLPFGHQLFVAQHGMVQLHSISSASPDPSWLSIVRKWPTKPIRIFSYRPQDAAVLAELLQHKRTVAFGLDIAPPPKTHSTSGILIVSDPRGNLVAARNETHELLHIYSATATVTHLSNTQATRNAVQNNLMHSDLFHFAGHGRSGGPGGWDSALLLADGELRVADIIMTHPVPQTVILSACEVASSGSENLFGVGLAQVFLVAGSKIVIASHQEVDSHVAQTFSTIFHRNLVRNKMPIHTAFRTTQQIMALSGLPTDAFVLLFR